MAFYLYNLFFNGKAKLLEHNVRFGDPECQTLMMRLEGDLAKILMAALMGLAACAPMTVSGRLLGAMGSLPKPRRGPMKRHATSAE